MNHESILPLRIAVVFFSILLMAGFVGYRAGMFGQNIRHKTDKNAAAQPDKDTLPVTSKPDFLSSSKVTLIQPYEPPAEKEALAENQIHPVKKQAFKPEITRPEARKEAPYFINAAVADTLRYFMSSSKVGPIFGSKDLGHRIDSIRVMPRDTSQKR